MSDKIAEALGNFFTFVWDVILAIFTEPSTALVVVGVGAGAVLLWRLSLVLGPEKVCWRCGGDGHVGGFLGGRKECTRCGGKGRRLRIGAK